MSKSAAVAVLACLWSAVAGAQVNPTLTWRTLATPHFRVHYTPGLEPAAQRAAVQAESAFVRLRKHLAPPAGTIDLVIADNVDYTNGYASPYPSNRIVVYANPPVSDDALRFYDDPTELVITHELTHIFQLDRARGMWYGLRLVFGRDPSYFPNAWQPSWLVEGLAVYYESLITGSGRLVGTNHRMIARTAAGARDFPRIHELSLSSPLFPYGYHAYGYGSLFVDHLGKTFGDSSVRAFVESSSAMIIPLWLNWPARRAFRTTLTAEYTRWAAAQVAAEPATVGTGIAGWRDLTTHGGYANVPRWLDDSTVVYDGTDGRSSYGAYLIRLHGDKGTTSRERVARRVTRSANIRLANGDLLYAEQEYTSPFDFRSDLFIDHGDDRRQLTFGARLANPDVRGDGRIVAVQTTPAATHLALVSAHGDTIAPITQGSLDEQWTEPRWSPDGARIAAIRWTHGGTSEVVVIDTAGRIVQSIARERAVNADPSWSADGRFVYFSSDRTGITNLYRAEFRETGDAPLERLSDTRTGLFEPQVSPDGKSLLAVAYRSRGYHIGIVPLDSLTPVPAEPIDSIAPRTAEPVTGTPLESQPYSAWRSLVPRYWIPYTEPALDSNSIRIGAYTSGYDIVGRHAYQALLYVPTDLSGVTGAFDYSYAGLGNPVLNVSASTDKENFRCVLDASQQNACIGMLRRRVSNATVAATLNRVRARTSAYMSLGGGVEVRNYSTSPAALIDRVDSLYQRTLYWPRVSLSLGASNVQYPLLAISGEDGISIAVTARQRWRLDRPVFAVPTGSDTVDRRGDALSVVGAASIYKSIPLPGFSHHVFAVRVAGGWIDSRNPDYLEVGGVSGGTFELFPSYVLGEGRRTFPVRGFPGAAMIGMRAYTATAEYRMPLALVGRGLGLWPAFIDRASVAFFGDLGSAWCPALFQTRLPPASSLCTQGDYDIGRTTFTNSYPAIYKAAYSIGSVGGELNLAASVLDWDRPLRWRVGAARPVIGTNLLGGVGGWSAYLAVGAAF